MEKIWSWTKSGALTQNRVQSIESFRFDCVWICLKKERTRKRLFIISLSSLSYIFVIYNAEKWKRNVSKKYTKQFFVCICDLRMKHLIYIVLRYSVYSFKYFANYENSALCVWVCGCVCVCDKYDSIWVFDFSIVGLIFVFLLFCFVFKHSLLLTPWSLCLLWFVYTLSMLDIRPDVVYTHICNCIIILTTFSSSCRYKYVKHSTTLKCQNGSLTLN